MDPTWGETLPALRLGYEQLIGHFHLERRGYRQWKTWMQRVFSSYFEDFFSKAASQCDAVILTSSALLETDLGLCPRVSSERMAGEIMRRFGCALLDPKVVDRIQGTQGTGSTPKPSVFALGSVTLRPRDDSHQLTKILERQSELVSGSFGELAIRDTPLFIATSIDDDLLDVTALEDELTRIDCGYPKRSEPVYMRAPRYHTDTGRPSALDFIALWPFKLDG